MRNEFKNDSRGAKFAIDASLMHMVRNGDIHQFTGDQVAAAYPDLARVKEFFSKVIIPD